MTDAANMYARTLERLQSGEPLSSISDEDLSITTSGVTIDVTDRLGRLNRFANARDALERMGELSGEERLRLVRIVALREQRGATLSAEHEALLAINAAAMLETMKVELERRSSSVN